jgi:hypothetical protein
VGDFEPLSIAAAERLKRKRFCAFGFGWILGVSSVLVFASTYERPRYAPQSFPVLQNTVPEAQPGLVKLGSAQEPLEKFPPHRILVP